MIAISLYVCHSRATAAFMVAISKRSQTNRPHFGRRNQNWDRTPDDRKCARLEHQCCVHVSSLLLVCCVCSVCVRVNSRTTVPFVSPSVARVLTPRPPTSLPPSPPISSCLRPITPRSGTVSRTHQTQQPAPLAHQHTVDSANDSQWWPPKSRHGGRTPANRARTRIRMSAAYPRTCLAARPPSTRRALPRVASSCCSRLTRSLLCCLSSRLSHPDGLFDCCAAGAGTCLTATVCPCVQYGKNVQVLGHGTFCSSCCIFAIVPLGCLCCSGPKRTEMRNAYRLKEVCVNDIITTCCCCCCSLVQIAAEINTRGVPQQQQMA